MELSKEQSRRRWKELRETVNNWDPVGLIELGAPEDEYECLVGQLMSLLELDTQPTGIADFLNYEIPHHFGVFLTKDANEFAARISRWFTEDRKAKEI